MGKLLPFHCCIFKLFKSVPLYNYFGGNPEKRKEIREMRDWWYKIVEENYTPNKKQMDIVAHLSTKLELLSDDFSKKQKKLRKDIVEDVHQLILNSEFMDSDKEQFIQTIGTTVSASTTYVTQNIDQCPHCGSKKIERAGIESGTLAKGSSKFLPVLEGYNCLECDKFFLNELR